MAKNKWLFACLSAAILLVGCVDEDSPMGLDLMERGSRISADTYNEIALQAHTLRDDSLTTSNFRIGVLGQYQDAVFGTTTTALYSQLSFPQTPIDYNATDYVLDSAILRLAYTGQFANQGQNAVRIVVSEIVDDLDLAANYYSTDTKATGEVLYDQVQNISEEILRNIRSDSTQALHLKIALDKTKMSKIIRSFATNADFHKFFKGIKITAEPTDLSQGGVMFYLDFLSQMSGVTLHFHNRQFNNADRLLFGNTSARFMQVTHQFDNAPLNAFQGNHAAQINGDNNIYLGTLGSTKAQITLSNMDTLRNRPINRATLVLPVSNMLGEVPAPPSKIGVFYYQKKENNDSVLIPIRDALISAQHYGAKYDPVNKEYRIRITSHLQNYLNGNVATPTIYLVSDTRKSIANRVVLQGTNAANRKARIEVIFTR